MDRLEYREQFVLALLRFGLKDRSRAHLWRRSFFNSHATWFPIRIWENELGYKAHEMLNLNMF